MASMLFWRTLNCADVTNLSIPHPPLVWGFKEIDKLQVTLHWCKSVLGLLLVNSSCPVVFNKLFQDSNNGKIVFTSPSKQVCFSLIIMFSAKLGVWEICITWNGLAEFMVWIRRRYDAFVCLSVCLYVCVFVTILYDYLGLCTVLKILTKYINPFKLLGWKRNIISPRILGTLADLCEILFMKQHYSYKCYV